MNIKKIAVIGLGLIGGSIAKAVKRNSNISVIGWNRSKNVSMTALEQGVIDRIWDGICVLDADLVIISAPPDATVSILKKNAAFFKKGSVISDVCGVKTHIVDKCEHICDVHDLFFIGGHPMAGKEQGGYANADEFLFDGASYILTPTEKTSKIALDVMSEFVKILKVDRITIAKPDEHDKMIAFTSQLPHVLAGAYVKSPRCENRKGFSAGSFLDVSRVATADEKLWSELFLNNSNHLSIEIQTLIDNLSSYLKAIENKDKAALCEIIKEGRLKKEKDLENNL